MMAHTKVQYLDHVKKNRMEPTEPQHEALEAQEQHTAPEAQEGARGRDTRQGSKGCDPNAHCAKTATLTVGQRLRAGGR